MLFISVSCGSVPLLYLRSITGLAVDVVFPVLHGPYGEDGTVQGLLELANIPYVGAGVLASSVGMDKAMAKLVFTAKGLPQTKYLVVLRNEWTAAAAKIKKDVSSTLGYPVFVKPANLGSIRSEAHGPHWVAWLARTTDGAPDQAVLIVGQTQGEAEARARLWAERR